MSAYREVLMYEKGSKCWYYNPEEGNVILRKHGKEVMEWASLDIFLEGHRARIEQLRQERQTEATCCTT
jgi:hypothetical protein